MRSRVAIVSPFLLGYEDGASRRVLLSLEAWRELGCAVTVFTVRGGIRLDNDLRVIELDNYEIEYHRTVSRELSKEFSLLRRYFFKIFTTIIRERFDVVEIHGVTRAAPQIAAFLAAKLSRARIVYNYHDLLPEEATLTRGVSHNSLMYELLLLFEKFMFGLSNRIIVVSDTMKDVLLARYGEKFRERIQVIYPNVDLHEFAGPKSTKFSVKRYGIPEHKPIVIYIGRLDPMIRGLENLMIAFGKLVREKRIDAYLLLVGKGSIREGLKQIAIEQGVIDRVVFTGSVVHEEAATLLREANIAVICYPESIGTHIALPTKIVEYMATGKIIVASRLAQIKRTLGGNAIFFDFKDPNSFADALEKAIHKIDEAEKVRKEVQRKARLFDKEMVKEKATELYKEICQ
jgi:glycosyltransferase involved in cell wall biosynthesis